MKILRNIGALVLGWLIGSVVNMGLVNLGHSVFPMEGVDLNDMDALAAAMPNMGAEHFLFPFLAHAVGTLVGAFIAAKIAISAKMKLAIGIGAFFLIGGIMVNTMLPGPLWFTVVDLIVAYLPMAYIGGKLGSK